MLGMHSKGLSFAFAQHLLSIFKLRGSAATSKLGAKASPQLAYHETLELGYDRRCGAELE